MAETILALCAHNDDHLLGAGGTLAKYAQEGCDVIVIIFSYGEKSHLWLKRHETIKMRVAEARIADKLLGIKQTYYYGLAEGKFEEEIDDKDIKTNIKRKISILRPKKIFTHSFDDPHPDHRAVYKIVNESMEKTRLKCDVYSFDIWNPFNIRKRHSPKLVVDITSTFDRKMKAFSYHRSQWMVKLVMIPASYIRAILNGLRRNMRYAEVFYKIK